MSREVPTQSPSPKDQRALVAIDLGAESCRVSLLRWSNNSPHIDLVHRFPNQAVERPDSLRWDIQHILLELEHGLAICADLAPEGIRSIAVDGWAVDYVRLDAHNNPVCGGNGSEVYLRDALQTFDSFMATVRPQTQS